jgi:hypothetical protein
MFTTIGSMANACVGNPRSTYFPNQGIAEISDMLLGIITLVVGAILLTQGYQLAGTVLVGVAIFQSPIICGNIGGYIKGKRLQNNS